MGDRNLTAGVLLKLLLLLHLLQLHHIVLVNLLVLGHNHLSLSGLVLDAGCHHLVVARLLLVHLCHVSIVLRRWRVDLSLLVQLLLLLLKEEFLLLLLLLVDFEAIYYVDFQLFAFLVRKFLQVKLEHFLVALRLVINNGHYAVQLLGRQELNLLAQSLSLSKTHKLLLDLLHFLGRLDLL